MWKHLLLVLCWSAFLFTDTRSYSLTTHRGTRGDQVIDINRWSNIIRFENEVNEYNRVNYRQAKSNTLYRTLKVEQFTFAIRYIYAEQTYLVDIYSNSRIVDSRRSAATMVQKSKILGKWVSGVSLNMSTWALWTFKTVADQKYRALRSSLVICTSKREGIQYTKWWPGKIAGSSDGNINMVDIHRSENSQDWVEEQKNPPMH